MIRLSLLGLTFLFTFICNAQIDSRNESFLFDIINDKEARKFYQEAASRHTIGITDPPEGPLRTMAEWEELQGVVITWASEFSILGQIVDAIKEETNVYIVCSNPSTVQNYLDFVDIDWSKNVHFLVQPFDSIWVRDYGPNSVYKNDVDSLILVDWIYNRPARVKDDVVPGRIAEELGLPLYVTVSDPYKFVATGGNFMSDGMGKAFSSELILDENPLQGLDGVDAVVKDFMGIEEYIKFENLPHDLIHHIDMHMKLLDEQTLMLGEYPEGVADGPQIEANLQYLLNNFTTSYGEPFKVIRMPMPPAWDGTYPDQNGDYRTYVNSLFVNKTILVPTYEEKYDSTALRIWEESMPGYNIVGINCNSIIPRSGALHCITKEIGVNDPVRIVHQEQDCFDETTSLRTFSAIIQHRSGIKDAFLHARSNLNNTNSFERYKMTLTDPETDTWSVSFEDLEEGIFSYDYFFTVIANSGKEMNRPMVAPEGLFNISDCSLISSIDASNIESQEYLDIFPNPASAITCIPLDLNRSRNIEINLHDMLGRKINTIFSGEATKGESKYFFDASNYEAGLYLVEFTDRESSFFQKLVIK